MKLSLRNITVIISATLFALSLTQPAFRVGNATNDWWPSILALLTGWLGITVSGAAICWVANPLLVTGWFLLYRRPKIAAWLGVLATIAAACFLLFDKVVIDEAGHTGPILAYGAGYRLWLAACGCFAAGATVAYLSDKSTGK